jgi:hypothetical protein
MKKIVSIVCIVCMLLMMSAVLVSCAHTCEFSDQWEIDKESHWHQCTKKDCTEQADKATHVWDEGVVTTEATQEKDGIKTYTCTVCGYVREEEHAYTPLTKEQWSQILSASNFQNFTYTETSTVSTTGLGITTKTVNYYTLNGVKVVVEISGKKETDTVTGNDATIIRTSMIESIRSLAEYEKYQFNAKTRKYEMKDPVYMESLGTDLATASITFRDGKLVEISYTAKIAQTEAKSKITFTDYGTTVIS